jgi:PPOX class probable F420-dependent enzyme
MTHIDDPILNEAVHYIIDGAHLSVLATINPDGTPQTSVVFVKRDGDDILFSTIKGRRKTINMERHPRVNLLIHGLPVDRPNQTGDGPNYTTISGTVQLTDDPDGAFHQEMYSIYMGGATPPPEPGAQRVIGRIVPERIYVPTFAAILGAAEGTDENQTHAGQEEPP